MSSKEMAEVRAREAATGILEVAAVHYALVVKHQWEPAEQVAQKLAEMAALSADGAQIMADRGMGSGT